MKSKNMTMTPAEPKQGSTAGEYSAMGVSDFKSEMMAISAGKYGTAGEKHDRARIQPYMMYNDTTDQNGY